MTGILNTDPETAGHSSGALPDNSHERAEQMLQRARRSATAPRAAAAIFTAAFNAGFDGDDWLTIGVDSGTVEVHITGQFTGGQIRFDPADVQILLDLLARILAKDTGLYAPYGVVSVKVPHGDGEPDAWAWHLKDMAPLTDDQALSWLAGEVRYKNGLPLAPDTDTDVTAFTEDVKELLAARGLDGS